MAAKRDAAKSAECEKARAALSDGDHRLARQLAAEVLANPSASDAAKAEAQAIDRATRVDRGALVTGLVMALVLAVLYAYVLTHKH